MIHPIDRDGYTKPIAWCVPSAVSLITGAPLTGSTALLSRISGLTYEELEGCWREEALLALGELGYRHEEVDLQGRYPGLTCGPTLKRYMSEARRHNAWEVVNPILIGLPGHVIVGHYGQLFDNQVPKGLPAGLFPQMGRLVKSVHIITRRH